jgi:hypothetical protein
MFCSVGMRVLGQAKLGLGLGEGAGSYLCLYNWLPTSQTTQLPQISTDSEIRKRKRISQITNQILLAF